MSQEFDFSSLSLQDALDLAILIEEDAEERYLEFNRQLGSTRKDDAGDFFETMAQNEAKHGRELAAQRKTLFAANKSNVSHEMLDEIRDVEAPSYEQTRSFMSYRHALEVALACEVKAYNFFDLALKSIKDQEVKRLFTLLRAEEVEHKNLVKKLLDKTSDDLAPEVDPGDVDEPAGL